MSERTEDPTEMHRADFPPDVHRTSWRRAGPAWVVLAAGLILTAVATVRAKSNADAQYEHDFASGCRETALKIQERLKDCQEILRSGAGLFDASEQVTREEWRGFVAALELDRHYPGILGMGFARLIPREDLAKHVREVRDEGFPAYRVWPEGRRDPYTSVVYLEPLSGPNLRAIGYDMLSEPVRRAAMERARDGGEAALSGKVVLVQENTAGVQAGNLMYVPVYRRGMPAGTVAERRKALRGWVYSPYRMGDLMAGILGKDFARTGAAIHLEVYDGETASPAALLFNSEGAGGSGPEAGATRVLESPIESAGRVWTLRFYSPSEGLFSPLYARAWLTLAAGTAVTLLFFALVLSLLNTRSEARRLAIRLTADLRESRNRLELALAGSSLGLWDWDLRSGRFAIDRRWADMLGYAPDEVPADKESRVERLVHPDDRAALRAAWDAHLRGEAPSYAFEYRMRHRDGHWLWIHDSGKIVERAPDGSPSRAAGTHQDITGRKRAEEELADYRERLERMVQERTQQLAAANEELGQWAKTLEAEVAEKTSEAEAMAAQFWQAAQLASLGELVATVAHEMNNPLATIVLRVEGLQAELAGAPAQAQSLAVVAREADRMAGFLDKLMVLSGRRTKRSSTLSLRKEIEGAARFMGTRFSKHGIHLVLEVDEALPPLFADRLALGQVFMNLMTNAVEAMTGGGTLTVRGRVEGREIALAFQDTGRGISPGLLDKVTVPFFTTKPEGQGTGLGLPVCKRIIEEYGGRMEISSAAGSGTTVRIFLPLDHHAGGAMEDSLVG